MRKVRLIIGCLLVSVAFEACGNSNEASGSGHGSTLVKKVEGAPNPPRVPVPTAPPPKKVIVKELKTGHGALLKAGHWFTVNYVAVEYKTGKRIQVHWGKSEAFNWKFGIGQVVKGWETGLKGMRVGARRRLLVPSKLAYGGGALVYVVELVEVQ